MRTQITIKFGAVDATTLSYDVPVTVATLKACRRARAALGYGDNVRVLLDGTELSDATQVPNGSTVIVETKVNSKAL